MISVYFNTPVMHNVLNCEIEFQKLISNLKGASDIRSVIRASVDNK